MFKWFKSKSKSSAPSAEPESSVATPPSEEHPEQPPARESGAVMQVIRQWDAAIADAGGQVDRILAEAATTSEPCLSGNQSDYEQLGRIWSRAKAQVRTHSEQVSDAWNKISDRLSDAECTAEVMRREGEKRDLANCEIDIRYERTYRAVMARAAEAMRQKALAGTPAVRRCSQCGGSLPAPTAVAQSENIACPKCSTTNLVEPSPAMRTFAASGALFVGQVAAQDSWEAMVRAETRIKNYRDRKEVPLELLKEFDAAAREYWTTSLSVEAEHVPEIRQHVAGKVESYMQGVQKTLRQFWQWRQQQG